MELERCCISFPLGLPTGLASASLAWVKMVGVFLSILRGSGKNGTRLQARL